MWYNLGRFILKNRIILLIVLFAATAYMGWHASKVQLSYEFSKAIPEDNEKYLDHLAFKKQFGEDGNVLVIGVQDDKFYNLQHFLAYKKMLDVIKTQAGINNIFSVPSSLNLTKSDTVEQLNAIPIFTDSINDQIKLDTAKSRFENLPFYYGLQYNKETKAYLAGISINKNILQSKERTEVVNKIITQIKIYEEATGVITYISGLPLIRTQVADRIKAEMNYFLFGSLLLATITMLLFFRSLNATLISLAVVIMGVLWALGTMHLFGYKITLLNALIPPLVIVIGIPNCIYFLNKFHSSWQEKLLEKNNATIGENKKAAILNMVSRMGIVTLFCNIAAGVGFAVFALTKSALLKEFGIVAGINIMVLFVISLIFIPAVLSYIPAPKAKHIKYLRNRFLENILIKIEHWVITRKKWVYAITSIVTIISILGIMRLKSVGFIVDDLPKQDKIYTDLKWFEKNFGGVMPLEIVVDTKKKNGITKSLSNLQKIEEFSNFINDQPVCARPMSLLEGLKFVKQAYYDGDSTSYGLPNEFDMAFISPYLKGKKSESASQFAKLLRNFTDSTKQLARISVNMNDIGTKELAKLLDTLQKKSATIFDSTVQIKFTGSSVSFLEGSKFIINGLKESIIWAFALIAICMLLLFKSGRILFCSLIPNIIPLIVTAGIMGWTGVALKPSTVLVFSVALGIAIDVTIRFLVNYKQELPMHHNNVMATTMSTIRHTGISIIYTSLVLVAGFIIFMFSGFGGTFSLGWLTSFTLLIATVTNLVLLPVIMLDILKKK